MIDTSTPITSDLIDRRAIVDRFWSVQEPDPDTIAVTPHVRRPTDTLAARHPLWFATAEKRTGSVKRPDRSAG